MAYLMFRTSSASWNFSKNSSHAFKTKTVKYSNRGPGKIDAFNEQFLPLMKGREVTWFIDNKDYLFMTQFAHNVFTEIGYSLGCSTRISSRLMYQPYGENPDTFKEYKNLDEQEIKFIKSTDIQWILYVDESFDYFTSEFNSFQYYGIKTIEQILDPIKINIVEPECSVYVDNKQPETPDTKKISSFIVDSIFEDKKLSMEDKVSKMKEVLNQWMQVGKEQNEIIDSVCNSVTDLYEVEGVITGKNFVNDKNVVSTLNKYVDFNKQKTIYVKQSVKSCYDDICKTLDIPYDMNGDFKLADLIALTRHCQINKKVIVTNILSTHYQSQKYPNMLYFHHMYPSMAKGHS